MDLTRRDFSGVHEGRAMSGDPREEGGPEDKVYEARKSSQGCELKDYLHGDPIACRALTPDISARWRPWGPIWPIV